MRACYGPWSNQPWNPIFVAVKSAHKQAQDTLQVDGRNMKIKKIACHHEEAAYKRLFSDIESSIDRDDPLQRMLAEEVAIARLRRGRAGSAAAIGRMAGRIGQDLLRCERLQRRVDTAFGDKPFLPDQSPVSPRHRQRFRKYFQMMKSLTMLKFKLIHEFMRVHGVNQSNPHEMWAIGEVAGGIGAAAGPAVAPSPVFASDHSSIRRQPIEAYSERVVRLAEHLTRHAHSPAVVSKQ